MSAQYDLYETPDIKQTGEKQPLHPRIVPKGTIGQDEFLDRVHKFTGISVVCWQEQCSLFKMS